MNYSDNKLKKILLSGLFASLFLISCKKEDLNPIPQTVLSDVSAFGSPERVKQQVFGVYSAIKSGQFLGGRSHVYNDVRGEDWVNTTGNGVTALGVWNFSLVSSDNQVENNWAAGYSAINRANVVLEGIDANAALLGSSANRFKAEVLFARALSYYYLSGLYSRRAYNADAGASPGLPLRLTANKSATGTALARSTVAQVFTQILTDLDFAEQNLPLSYPAPVSDSNVSRAHRNAAIAMKTRIYLTMGKYAEVITEANKLVPLAPPYVATSGVPHSLATSVLSVFRTPYTLPESIFSLPMAVSNSPGTQNGLGSYWTSEFSLNTAGILADPNWKTTDARRTSFVSGTVPPIRWTKFNDDLNNYVPIIRYAEVMLNLAEALARTSPGVVNPRALALLNAIRQRSDATTTFAPLTQQELIDLIMNERRIEFLGEGHRNNDVMRILAPFAAKGSVSSVPISSVSYVWPIPASELLFNSAMTQNQ